ncbi:hypothetical protein CALCODRAFT_158720 [Calocera cornea HHB12733]|uniref:Uncharacterized protein n=1 Tax=Calocera cornea HHB12733 TaxID=1353952 RepID=A0A165I1D4_9BASI|nr:hypothetical protein CALCODRAFT_158720 [Calocera cornea HHB12733]
MMTISSTDEESLLDRQEDGGDPPADRLWMGMMPPEMPVAEERAPRVNIASKLHYLQLARGQMQGVGLRTYAARRPLEKPWVDQDLAVAAHELLQEQRTGREGEQETAMLEDPGLQNVLRNRPGAARWNPRPPQLSEDATKLLRSIKRLFKLAPPLR